MELVKLLSSLKSYYKYLPQRFGSWAWPGARGWTKCIKKFTKSSPVGSVSRRSLYIMWCSAGKFHVSIIFFHLFFTFFLLFFFFSSGRTLLIKWSYSKLNWFERSWPVTSIKQKCNLKVCIKSKEIIISTFLTSKNIKKN